MPFGIDRGVVEPFRLEENLVPVALAEAHDLVLDRGAIARPPAGDLAGIHRRAMDVGADDPVGRLGGPGDAALDLRVLDPLGQHRERLRRLVAGLHLDRRPVDGGAVDPRRRPGLEPAERKAEALQRQRQSDRRRLPDPAGRRLPFADMDQPAQKRPGGQHHRGGRQLPAVLEAQPRDLPGRHHEIVGLAFDHRQVFGRRDRRLHGGGIALAIRLGARPAHRRTLAAVEHPELDSAAVRDAAHEPVERIDLADQVALAQTADRRIARHRADGRERVRDQRGRRAHARSRGRGFTAGMAAAHDDDVEPRLHFQNLRSAS